MTMSTSEEMRLFITAGETDLLSLHGWRPTTSLTTMLFQFTSGRGRKSFGGLFLPRRKWSTGQMKTSIFQWRTKTSSNGGVWAPMSTAWQAGKTKSSSPTTTSPTSTLASVISTAIPTESTRTGGRCTSSNPESPTWMWLEVSPACGTSWATNTPSTRRLPKDQA